MSLRMVRRAAWLMMLFLALGSAVRMPPLLIASAAQQPSAPDISFSAAQGDSAHRAGLVVRFGDGTVQTRCVTFTEPELTGEELLQRSGLNVILDYNAGLGGAVCSIAGVGCSYPAQDCFCQCRGSECQYWAYYHWQSGAWQYSSMGASSHTITDGALDGWSWGPGNFVAGVEPPVMSFDQVCLPLATATPTATLPPTSTPTATPTATRPETLTPTPTPRTTAPQVRFEASALELAAGGCAILQWTTWDADRVLLNGAPVFGQDRVEVCPAATMRYVLAASNAAGETVREITLQVVVPTPPPEQGLAPTPTMTTAGAGPTFAPLALAVPSATPAATPPPVSADFQPAVSPEPPTPAPAVPAVAHMQSAEGLLALARLPTATVRPRRTLAADGRPTATPILAAPALRAKQVGVAEASGAIPQSGEAHGPGNGRAFTTSLLPGYGAYMLTMALLVAVAGWTARRRRDRSVASEEGGAERSA